MNKTKFCVYYMRKRKKGDENTFNNNEISIIPDLTKNGYNNNDAENTNKKK